LTAGLDLPMVGVFTNQSFKTKIVGAALIKQQWRSSVDC
jgi:hypothetical protein